MASPARIGRTVRAATITVILAAFAVLPGCLHDSGDPDPLVFTGPSTPLLWGPLPSFSFSPADPDAGDTVSFDASRSSTDPGFAITSYAWSFPGGTPPTATGATASAQFANKGTFAVRLTVTDNRATSTPVSEVVDVEVDILTPPRAAFVLSIVGTAPSAAVNFDGSTSTTEPGRTITNYAWVFGDGQSSLTNAGPTVQNIYATAGNFNATLTVTDTAGLTGAASNTVLVP